MQQTLIFRTPRDQYPHCKLSVLVETYGSMPMEFDNASDFGLPLRYAFYDRFAPELRARAMKLAPAGKTGTGLVCREFLAARGVSCDIWITAQISRPVPTVEIEEMIIHLIDKPIISHRLKSVFKEDRQANRLASKIARMRREPKVPKDKELMALAGEVDETTYPDLRVLLATG